MKNEIKQDSAPCGFFQIADFHLQDLKDKDKVHRVNNAKGRLEIFRDFLKTSSIDIRDIDVSLLNKFESHLIKTRKVSKRTVISLG